ncbi:YgiQ family radical SAM protein [Pleionea sp. CnH1-48]|uniref:YgiQ family radical SAM protein n=1 Tax=Pleionea sp. CnH1-48 TaxID=2954494 RepID=UPI0020979798|nr:YgiQ family radical SAM protein [Pleionea sp. CnH1-48]MCO7227469.1 YgiQ family radical SAM protein [Pleionea sp. CnH1-48]
MKLKSTSLFSYPKYWAECYGASPFLPMSRAEMDELGWDSCDIILVTGDAYVDHPSFGMAVMGRFLESQGFRVGIIAQPDWNNPEEFTKLGQPNLFFGVTAGNMDSLINKYTADLKVRNDDAYTPHGAAGKRPERAVIVYSQKCREAYKDTPIVIGGIEASLRRIAQYDYWSNQVRRSVLIDSGADILLYGNAERAIAEIAHEISLGKNVEDLTSIRGTTIVRNTIPGGWTEIDSSRIDWPGNIDAMPNPYEYAHTEGENNYSGEQGAADCQFKGQEPPADEVPIRIIPMPLTRREKLNPETTYIRLPSFEKVNKDSALYAHASRVLHLESNPSNARTLVQKHGTQEIWVNPPPIPLETDEMDGVFDLPYQRVPHPSYGDANIPAYEMIRFSVNIMRGCFGGCTFCSITEHEGRVIQSRSQESILREIENIRDKTPGFTGTISDLGGPTANMYHLNCKDDDIQANCRKLSCVFPTICKNLITDHKHTTELYREARAIPGVKRVAIASGLRYDLAVEDPEYVKELVTHHVGGYLKIAPEHTERKTLDHMMKPGIDTYDTFKKMFEKYSKEAGKKQYLIPYFIAAHPGCEDEDMLNLALWLKKNGFQADQVQTFYPSPMALATAMYHSDRNPLSKVSYKTKKLFTAKALEQRRLHKAFLRYHDHKNWPTLRNALKKMGRQELIGDGDNQLIPLDDKKQAGRRGGKPQSQPRKSFNPRLKKQNKSRGRGASR